MKTIYTKDGSPIVMAQDLDALEALKTGHYFNAPPGKKVATPEKEKMSSGVMSSQQLVDYAKDKFDANLDPLVKHDVLVKQVEELEKLHKMDFEDDYSNSGDASSKPEKKIVKRMK